MYMYVPIKCPESGVYKRVTKFACPTWNLPIIVINYEYYYNKMYAVIFGI